MYQGVFLGSLPLTFMTNTIKDNTTCCGGSTHKPGAYGSQKLKVDHERGKLSEIIGGYGDGE
jgi:hypothetical protein